MSSQINAEILSVGTELLMGEITDTNSRFLAGELKLLGITAARMTTAGDDKVRLTRVFREALSRSNLIIASGGLGPTEDDLTRDCLAEALEETLSSDPVLEKGIRDFFANYRRGRMPEHNLRQAMVIPSGKPIINNKGTAPGWWVEKNGRVVILLPGPPREMEPMWRQEIKPRLELRFPGNIALTHTLKVFSMGEATVDEAVEPLFHLGNPELGIYAKPEGVHLRLIARGENAPHLVADAEKRIRNILKEHIWGTGDETLSGLAVKLLEQKNLTASIFDSGTGGVLTALLSEIKDYDKCIRGSIIAAGIPQGWSAHQLFNEPEIISPARAEALAANVREYFSTDIGLAVTGITGISGGTGTPGTAFIAVADANGIISWRQTIIPRRDLAPNQLAISALFRLRQHLIGIQTDF